MSIELKVGEWYETRAGDRLKLVLDISSHCDSLAPGDKSTHMALDRDGGCVFYHPCGGYMNPIGAGPLGPSDITKHLPECTGWDWQEPKWRDARPEDALCDPPLRCRVRDCDTGEWGADGTRLLVGHTHPKYDRYPWRMWKEGVPDSTGWKYCQVLDE